MSVGASASLKLGSSLFVDEECRREDDSMVWRIRWFVDVGFGGGEDESRVALVELPPELISPCERCTGGVSQK
jgi:hypothetical protein